MANIYVRSTDGSDADNGSTWALAKATLTGAAAIDAAGDTIYVSDNHAESSASAQTIALAGTAASPVRVICVDDAGDPVTPTTVATTATVTTTGGNAITITGSCYIEGITFQIGSGNNIANFVCATDGSVYILNNCAISLVNTNVSSRVVVGSSNVASTECYAALKNCVLKFGSTSQGLNVNKCRFEMTGGSIASGGSTPASLIVSVVDTVYATIKDFDFSNFGATFNFLASSLSVNGRVDIINCKLPTSWSGGVVAGAPTMPSFRASMYNCDSGAANYRLWIETYAGSIKSETTLVKTGGASDGTTALSWKLTTTANANETVAPLITDDMAVWIDSTGISKTVAVDILHDSTTALTDAEVWLEIDYLGSSAQPLGTPASDKRATVLTTAADQTTSSATWTTTGMTNPNKQKLEVTFTPQMKGFVYARVCLAKASYTIYVDPEPVIS